LPSSAVLIFVAISAINASVLSSSASRARLRVMRSADDAQLECEADRLRATSRTELDEDTLEMPVHRPFADAKDSGDLLRGLSERDVSQDLDFSPRKRWTHGLLLRRHRKN
jgi:hypothetical protein